MCALYFGMLGACVKRAICFSLSMTSRVNADPSLSDFGISEPLSMAVHVSVWLSIQAAPGESAGSCNAAAEKLRRHRPQLPREGLQRRPLALLQYVRQSARNACSDIYYINKSCMRLLHWYHFNACMQHPT